MIQIELTQDEVKTLATLIDAAVRHSGIQAVRPAVQIIDRMDAALAAAAKAEQQKGNDDGEV
jgi:hypothetical protein